MGDCLSIDIDSACGRNNGLLQWNLSGISVRWVILRECRSSRSLLILEKPAIDRLLDYIWSEEARKPAIDKLIQEYLERIGSPFIYQCPPSAVIPLTSMWTFSSMIFVTFCVGLEPATESKPVSITCAQQTQTPSRSIQHYPSAPSFNHTSNTSGYESSGVCNNSFELPPTSSTPLLR